MVGKILSIMTNVEALQMIDYQIPQHYIRFFGGEIIFECIYLLKNGVCIKRKYFAMTYPTTCEELILFVKKIPRLLDRKQTIITQTKKMLACDE
ncbi:hypothetical protein EDC94DRAFT_635810 [Helicostylum pulchrum]|nr:hypothetical protein EDC94DRAFT_635810 [Helicostylum pulchrum]